MEKRRKVGRVEVLMRIELDDDINGTTTVILQNEM